MRLPQSIDPTERQRFLGRFPHREEAFPVDETVEVTRGDRRRARTPTVAAGTKQGRLGFAGDPSAVFFEDSPL